MSQINLLTLTLLSLGILSQKLKKKVRYLGKSENTEEEVSLPAWAQMVEGSTPCANVLKAPSDITHKLGYLPGRSKKIRLLQAEKGVVQTTEAQASGGPVIAETCCMPWHEGSGVVKRRLGQDPEEFRLLWTLSLMFYEHVSQRRTLTGSPSWPQKISGPQSKKNERIRGMALQ